MVPLHIVKQDEPVSAFGRKVPLSPRTRRNVVALLLTVFLTLGCTTAQVQFARKTQTIAERRDSVLLLALTESPLEIEAQECIGDSVRAAIPGVRIIDRDEFRRQVFYYGYPESGEEAARYLTSLARHPLTKARIAELGLRYVVSIQGGTEQQAEPIFGAAGGPAGGITVFGAHWTRKSRLEASIFDFQEVADAGTIRSLAEGDPWFICVGIGPFCAPMGAAAFTESKACSGLGTAVATFLTGGNPPDAATSTGEKSADRAPPE